MGLLDWIKDKATSAGANVSVFFFAGVDKDKRESWPDSIWQLSVDGLEIHNMGREAKKRILKLLDTGVNLLPKQPKLPEDYPMLASHLLARIYVDHGRNITGVAAQQTSELCSLIVDCFFFDKLKEGDLISIYITLDKAMFVERLRPKEFQLDSIKITQF